MSASIFARASGIGQNSGQGVSSTDEFQFADGQATAVRLRLRIPPDIVRSGVPFVVRAGGRVTGGGTTNFTANLDHGDSATIGSNTTIETTGAVAVNSTSDSWQLEAILGVDATSSLLNGRGWGRVAATVAATAATAEVSSVDPTAEVAFTVTGLFSGSDAGTFAICDYFHAAAL